MSEKPPRDEAREMKVARRTLFGMSAAGAVGAFCLWVPRLWEETQPLATDPDGREFVYRDGWIVRR